MNSTILKRTLALLTATLSYAVVFGQNWTTTGNAGTTPASNFVGTTDSVALVFRTNNLERMRINAIGNLLLGTSTDNGYKFNVSGGIRTSADMLVNGLTLGQGAGTGTNNVALGANAFAANTTGYGNVSIGNFAARYNRKGVQNVAVGYQAAGTNAADSAVGSYVAIGALSRVYGVRGVSVGHSSISSTSAVAVGTDANASNQYAVSVGNASSAAGGLGAVAIGSNAKVLHSGGIVLGYNLSTTNVYQLLIGNSTPGYSTRDVYIGGGVTQTFASSYAPLTIQPTGQSGVNQTGQTIRIATGKGTGSANPGDIHLMTSTSRASGDTLQDLSTRFIVKGTTGNIGIGTTAPSSQLHSTGSVRFAGLTLDSTKTRYIVADNNGNLSYRSLPSGLTGGGSGTVSGTTNYIPRYSSGTSIGNSIMYDNGNSIGIGLISMADTSFRLFVEKGIRTRKVKVDVSSWADLVFEPGYELRPLEQLREYIARHRHLPEVPTEKEVRTTGVDIQEQQALLLKKVEELTLYILQLEQRISELESTKTIQR